MMFAKGATLALSALSVVGAEASTSLGGGNDVELPLVRLFLGLILCVAIAILAILALRRFKTGRPLAPNFASLLGPRAAAREIKVCETLRLSPQSDVVRLNWSGADYLVVVSPGAIALIDKRAISETTAS